MSLDVTLSKMVMSEVYSDNITHNLNTMAEKAGIYKYLWRPEEVIHSPIIHAKQLIEPLTIGLAKLESDPEVYKAFNPTNGWGEYATLVTFVRSYLKACQENPDAEVSISR